MKKVFWGFFFIYLNFNLTLNGFTLNLLPDFVGYLLLYQAAGTLAGESGRFPKLRPFSVAMAVYTGICGWESCWVSPGKTGWAPFWASLPRQWACSSPGAWSRLFWRWRAPGVRT